MARCTEPAEPSPRPEAGLAVRRSASTRRGDGTLPATVWLRTQRRPLAVAAAPPLRLAPAALVAALSRRLAARPAAAAALPRRAAATALGHAARAALGHASAPRAAADVVLARRGASRRRGRARGPWTTARNVLPPGGSRHPCATPSSPCCLSIGGAAPQAHLRTVYLSARAGLGDGFAVVDPVERGPEAAPRVREAQGRRRLAGIPPLYTQPGSQVQGPLCARGLQVRGAPLRRCQSANPVGASPEAGSWNGPPSCRLFTGRGLRGPRAVRSAVGGEPAVGARPPCRCPSPRAPRGSPWAGLGGRGGRRRAG